jgi:hypothetical protein
MTEHTAGVPDVTSPELEADPWAACAHLRFPNLRLAVPPERLRWRGVLTLRGLVSLPVLLD